MNFIFCSIGRNENIIPNGTNIIKNGNKIFRNTSDKLDIPLKINLSRNENKSFCSKYPSIDALFGVVTSEP